MVFLRFLVHLRRRKPHVYPLFLALQVLHVRQLPLSRGFRYGVFFLRHKTPVSKQRKQFLWVVFFGKEKSKQKKEIMTLLVWVCSLPAEFQNQERPRDGWISCISHSIQSPFSVRSWSFVLVLPNVLLIFPLVFVGWSMPSLFLYIPRYFLLLMRMALVWRTNSPSRTPCVL